MTIDCFGQDVTNEYQLTDDDESLIRDLAEHSEWSAHQLRQVRRALGDRWKPDYIRKVMRAVAAEPLPPAPRGQGDPYDTAGAHRGTAGPGSAETGA